MTPKTLKTAITEAERFLRKAKKVTTWMTLDGVVLIDEGKYSAACKRASMDLTRALAELRKPR